MSLQKVQFTKQQQRRELSKYLQEEEKQNHKPFPKKKPKKKLMQDKNLLHLKQFAPIKIDSSDSSDEDEEMLKKRIKATKKLKNMSFGDKPM